MCRQELYEPLHEEAVSEAFTNEFVRIRTA